MCPSDRYQEKPEIHERIYNNCCRIKTVTHHEGAADRKALNKDFIKFLKRASRTGRLS
jgi:hypothetical protein